MRLHYDPSTDSLYIELSARPAIDAVEVRDGVVLDLDKDGQPVGIDIQHASRTADLSRIDSDGFPAA